MRKKILICLLLFNLALLPGISGQASAHVLESSGDIGAVLHIDPDDDPVAGEQSSIYFDFKDKTNRFKSENCQCRLVIERAGQVIYDQTFSQPGGGTFIFPSRDVYKVKAVGEPKNSGEFDNFQISFDVRVERGSGQETVSTDSDGSSNKLVFLIAGLMATFFALIAIRYIVVKNAKPK